MPTWLLTSTFYGRWLPGDPRGSVTNVRDRRPDDPKTPVRIEHSCFGDPYEEAIPGLQRTARENLKGQPVSVDLSQAEQLLEQFQETAAYRGWTLLAVAVMANHIHIVIDAPPEVGKSQLLRDFKSYGARRLNRLFGSPPAGTWWTDSGSCRVVRYVPAAMFYVCHREYHPLVVWSRERGPIPPEESDPGNVFRESGSANAPPANAGGSPG
jgi:REP element-mobilizing transposase RayT